NSLVKRSLGRRKGKLSEIMTKPIFPMARSIPWSWTPPVPLPPLMPPPRAAADPAAAVRRQLWFPFVLHQLEMLPSRVASAKGAGPDCLREQRPHRLAAAVLGGVERPSLDVECG